MRSKIAVFVLILVLVAAGNAQEAKENEAEGKIYSSSTSFSLLLTGGNNKGLTFGLDTEQNLSFDKNRLQLKGSIIYSKSDESKASELYYGHLEYKRTLSSRAYLLGLGRFERNVLSGYNYRLAFSAGAGYTWTESEDLSFSSEVALAWNSENNIKKNNGDNVSLGFASCLIVNKLKIHLSKGSEINYTGIFTLNLDNANDYRLSTLLSLSVAISSHLALKTSYQVKYNHQPVPGFKDTDIYLLSSLVINF